MQGGKGDLCWVGSDELRLAEVSDAGRSEPKGSLYSLPKIIIIISAPHHALWNSFAFHVQDREAQETTLA